MGHKYLVRDIDYKIIQTDNVYNEAKTDFKSNLKNFYNINDTIKINEEYKEDIGTANYIKKRQIKINEDIENYKFNQELCEDVKASVTNVNKKIEDFRNTLETLAKYSEEMEDIENSHNIKEKVKTQTKTEHVNVNKTAITDNSYYPGIDDMSIDERRAYVDSQKINLEDLGNIKIKTEDGRIN